MAAVWTLTHDATTQTLAEWGIINPVLQRTNLGLETLSFSIPADGLAEEPVFDYGDAITLLRDDVIWFKGTVRDLPAAYEREERQRYVVVNAWELLQSIIYQQRYTLSKSDYSGLIGSWSSRVVLGKDQWGKPRRADQVISDVVGFANMVGAGVATLGTLPAWAVPPIETVRDISCAEVIRRMLAYVPDAVGWWDYSSGTPVLTVERRADLDAVEIDLADGDKVEVIDGLNPLHRSVPAGVVIVFVHTEEDGDGVPRLRETRQSAGATRGPRVVFATVNLNPDEDPPTGLASQYFGALSTLQYAGTVRLKEEDCSGLLRPGKVLNLAGGRTAWATMNATVQSSVEELATGVTTVEIGAAEHLGLGDFVDLMRRWRERNAPDKFAESQDNGTEGVAEQEPDSDPSPDSGDPAGPSGNDPDAETPEPNPEAGQPAVFPTVDIEACVGGTPKTLRVVGVRIEDPA